MRIPSNVLSFAQNNIDVYKAFGDYFNHYRAVTFGAKVDYDNSVSLGEKSDKIHEAAKKEIARVAGVENFASLAPEVWVTNPMYEWASFAVIGAMVDTILPQAIIDSVGLYTDVKVGGFGDNFSFDIKPNDLFVVSKAGRGKRKSEVHKQFDGQVTITPVEHDITVAVSLYRVLSGQENLADFAMKAVRSMETQMTYDVYDTFSTAMDNLPTGATGLKVSGYSQDAIVRLAQTVTAFNQGQKAVIVGTQLALSKVLPADTNYRMQIESDYVKLGYVRNFFGYDLMALPQVADHQTPYGLKLKDNRLYVISPSSQKLVKLCIEGSTMTITDGANDNANLTQASTLKKSWAAGIATNSIAGEIVLS